MQCDENNNYNFTTEVLCDETITGQGNPVLKKIDQSTCDIKIVVAHTSGCPAGQIMNFQQFMVDYPWLFGLIMILGGPIVALFGRKFFPWVIFCCVGITFFMATLIFCSLLGFMETWLGVGISVLVGIFISGFAGWLAFRTVWVAVGILGLIGGFFLGTMIFTIFLAMLGFGQLWAMILCGILCAISGGALSWKYAKAVVLFSTSLIGSYSFMRGISYFAGGFPSEAVIMYALKN